jgi:toxin ParE1/3/4
MELVLLLRAESDALRIYAKYEALREGRGELFVAALEKGLNQLRTFPESGPTLRVPFRRLLIRRFPYGVVYAVEGGRVIVYSIAPLGQDPKTLLAILDDPGS